jgi:transcriptional regulator with XRE-family HTH domain
MLNINSLLMGELQDKEYRDAYVASQVRISLPLQTRALRKGREWSQPDLAVAAGMTQPRISELETPGGRKLTIETLLRLASAFDVALQVRFVPYSELVDWSEHLNFDRLRIKPFVEELAEAKHREEQMKAKKRSQSLSIDQLKLAWDVPPQKNLVVIDEYKRRSQQAKIEKPPEGKDPFDIIFAGERNETSFSSAS